MWNYHGGDNQIFAFIPVGNGYHRITPGHRNKPVDVEGVSIEDGTLLQQWRYVLGGNQQWRLEAISVNVRMQSHNNPDRYVRHSDYRAQIEANVSPAQDSQFKMVSGLADSSGISFESIIFTRRYLRVRSNGEVWLYSNDSTTTFANDATFVVLQD